MRQRSVARHTRRSARVVREIAYDATGRWLGATRNTGDGYTVMVWDLTEPGAPPIEVGPGVEYRFLPGQRMVVADPTRRR